MIHVESFVRQLLQRQESVSKTFVASMQLLHCFCSVVTMLLLSLFVVHLEKHILMSSVKRPCVPNFAKSLLVHGTVRETCIPVLCCNQEKIFVYKSLITNCLYLCKISKILLYILTWDGFHTPSPVLRHKSPLKKSRRTSGPVMWMIIIVHKSGTAVFWVTSWRAN